MRAEPSLATLSNTATLRRSMRHPAPHVQSSPYSYTTCSSPPLPLRLCHHCPSSSHLLLLGYFHDEMLRKFSLMLLGLTHLSRLAIPPALSFVPLPLAPPKGC